MVSSAPDTTFSCFFLKMIIAIKQQFDFTLMGSTTTIYLLRLFKLSEDLSLLLLCNAETIL